jgi:hypothetical protein
MTLGSRLFAFVLAISAVLGAAAWGYAQGSAKPRELGPPVLSGPDIGFRLVSHNSKGKVVGRLVVRIDGDWKEVEFEHTVTPVR